MKMGMSNMLMVSGLWMVLSKFVYLVRLQETVDFRATLRLLLVAILSTVADSGALIIGISGASTMFTMLVFGIFLVGGVLAVVICNPTGYALAVLLGMCFAYYASAQMGCRLMNKFIPMPRNNSAGISTQNHAYLMNLISFLGLLILLIVAFFDQLVMRKVS